MRRLSLALALSLVPAPALAAGLGLDLPRYRHLALRDATGRLVALGWGGLGAPVLDMALPLGPLRLEAGLEYTYVRDFHLPSNYSFFDARVGLGLRLDVSERVYLIPALEGHALMTLLSPEGLDGLAWGYAPRLTVGLRVTPAAAVELAYGLTTVPGWRTAGPLSGTLGSFSVGGSYRF